MKYYKLTFTEYHDEIEDTDKRFIIQYCMNDSDERINQMYQVDIERDIRNNMLNEMKMKLGLI